MKSCHTSTEYHLLRVVGVVGQARFDGLEKLVVQGEDSCKRVEKNQQVLPLSTR